MRLGVWLPRANHLRVLHPVANAARRNGDRVVWMCPAPRSAKDDGAAAVHRLGDGAVAVGRQSPCPDVDAIVAVGLCLGGSGPDNPWLRWRDAHAAHPLWCAVGYLLEEVLQAIRSPALVATWDLICVPSLEASRWLVNAASRAPGLLSRIRLTGAPQLGPPAPGLRTAGRALLRIEPWQRVLLVPAPPRLHVMSRRRLLAFAMPSASLARLVAPDVTPAVAVLRMARRFARQHGALLVVKRRQKDLWLPWFRRYADCLIDDDFGWPQAAQAAAAAADAYVGFASGFALEATAAGLRQVHVLPCPSQHAVPADALAVRAHFWERGLWAAAGVSRLCERAPGLPWVSRFCERAPGLPWASWPDPVEPACAASALADLAGPLDGQAPQRILDAVHWALAARALARGDW